jgi:FkbM family methyltransferase
VSVATNPFDVETGIGPGLTAITAPPLSVDVAPPKLNALIGLLRPFLRLAWPLSWPVRWYWLHSDRKLGKKLVLDHVLKRMLPAPPAGFYAALPSGRVFLRYREDIGLAVLLSGGFESAEIAFAVEQARPGTVVIDVGANIGMFTIPLAHAVGARGRVVAIEPSPENVRRLETNIELNALENVTVEPIAAAERAGSTLLRLATDPAFHSTATVAEARETNLTISVPTETLDHVWERLGEPEVSLVKVDTEGGECSVLRGAARLLSNSGPAVLVEAKDQDSVSELDRWLTRFDYARATKPGISNGNAVYVASHRHPER